MDFQLTPRSRILLGILGGVLLILLAIQVGPAFYRLFVNHDTKAKQEQLLQTQNLVHAAEVLRHVESEIYKETGLTLALNQQESPNSQSARAGTRPASTIFDTELPETVIRSRIDALIRRAGIQQNYQLLTKPVTTKHTQKLTAQNRGNLVLYLYLKHIETEEMELAEVSEQQAEEETFNILMDAWLSGTESGTDKKTGETEGSKSGTESDANETEPTDKVKPTDSMDATAPWKFSSLPDAIPITVRAKLAAFIRSMVTRQLRGAANSRQDFFETQLQRVETPATPGIFGIGAKPATVEIQLRTDSALLEIIAYSEDSVEIGELQYALVKYIEEIQEQRATLLKQLALAPLTYQTEHYTVEMKFKTDLEKLVNLNHLIETGAKWLTVRDLRISADKQTGARPAARGRNSDGGANLNVDMLLIARIF